MISDCYIYYSIVAGIIFALSVFYFFGYRCRGSFWRERGEIIWFTNDWKTNRKRGRKNRSRSSGKLILSFDRYSLEFGLILSLMNHLLVHLFWVLIRFFSLWLILTTSLPPGQNFPTRLYIRHRLSYVSSVLLLFGYSV